MDAFCECVVRPIKTAVLDHFASHVKIGIETIDKTPWEKHGVILIAILDASGIERTKSFTKLFERFLRLNLDSVKVGHNCIRSAARFRVRIGLKVV